MNEKTFPLPHRRRTLIFCAYCCWTIAPRSLFHICLPLSCNPWPLSLCCDETPDSSRVGCQGFSPRANKNLEPCFLTSSSSEETVRTEAKPLSFRASHFSIDSSDAPLPSGGKDLQSHGSNSAHTHILPSLFL